ncbi:hypothetical protein ABZV91_23630 [Nocardia sp. NPDC004568]|uniref:hypothetical protein n=1 Tax=Nocardia sp. NPDC004568 TaxID=3154551 RepID=UPI0033ACAFD3
MTYDPPVTLTPQVTTVHGVGDLPLCPVGGPISSVQYEYTTTITKSCIDIVEGGSGTRVFTYNTGDTSTFAYNRTVTTVDGVPVVTATGTITAGEFAGALAEQVTVQAALNPLCLGGVASVTGAVTLAIVSVQKPGPRRRRAAPSPGSGS